jgi:hypothetical protein
LCVVCVVCVLLCVVCVLLCVVCVLLCVVCVLLCVVCVLLCVVCVLLCVVCVVCFVCVLCFVCVVCVVCVVYICKYMRNLIKTITVRSSDSLCRRNFLNCVRILESNDSAETVDGEPLSSSLSSKDSQPAERLPPTPTDESRSVVVHLATPQLQQACRAKGVAAERNTTASSHLPPTVSALYWANLRKGGKAATQKSQTKDELT